VLSAAGSHRTEKTGNTGISFPIVSGGELSATLGEALGVNGLVRVGVWEELGNGDVEVEVQIIVEQLLEDKVLPKSKSRSFDCGEAVDHCDQGIQSIRQILARVQSGDGFSGDQNDELFHFRVFEPARRREIRCRLLSGGGDVETVCGKRLTPC